MSEGAPKTAQRADQLPGELAESRAHGLDLDHQLAQSSGPHPVPPLDFADGSFELIWSLSAFAALSEGRAAWLAEIARLLEVGGVFIASLPTPPKKGVQPGRDWLSLRRVASAAPHQMPANGNDGITAFLQALDASGRAEKDAQREKFHRELLRKSLRIAELESASARVSLNWRQTRPVRAVKRILGRR